jgi:hypothetical protein
MIVAFILKINHLPPQIPLFYSNPWGEDQLGDTWMLFFLPLILNIVFLVNRYFYNRYFSGDFFVKKIFEYVNLFLIVSFTLVFIKIILLVS